MIRRDSFRRLASMIAAPVAVSAAVVQRAGEATARRIGELSIEAYEGWSAAFVWNGRAWVMVSPDGPGWSALVGQFTRDELTRIAVTVDGVSHYASEYIK